MKSSNLRKILFLSLVCVWAGGSALAAEQNDVQVNQFILDEYVVTDSRVQTKLVDTPANISVITQEQLEKGNFTNVKEVLRDVPGVQLSQGGNNGSNMGKDEIYINGDNRVLVLIDGRRMNLGGDGRYSANWLPPLEAIERVEVIKGASSAMYGSDAVGGIINIITKSGGDGKTTVKAGYGSFGTQDYTLATGGRDKGLGYYITYNHQQRGDFSYKNLDGSINSAQNSDYENKSVVLKIDKEIGKDGKLTLNYEHFNVYAGVPWDYYGNATTDSTKRVMNNIALKYDWGIDTNRAGFVQIYQNYQRAQQNSTDPSIYGDFNERKIGITIQQNFKTHEKNKMTVGLDWSNAKIKNELKFKDQSGDIENKAIYLENSWSLDDSWKINSGIRYDHYNKAGGKPTLHFAVNKKFNENSHAYISWGQVFRAPAGEQLYWDEQYMKGDPNLKPEYGYVWTVGYDTKIAQKTTLGINAFYSRIKDAIVWVYYPAASQIENLETEKRRGMELSVNHKFDDVWSLDASYTYVNVEGKGGYGADLGEKMKPNIYKLGVQYSKDKLAIRALLHGASGQKLSEYTKRSYWTMDLNAQYKFTKNLKAYLNIYNLNNAAYEEAPGRFYPGSSAKYPMPSRTIIGGVQVTF